MVSTEKKEGHVVMETYIGNCHVRFCDDYVLKDEEEIKKQLKRIEQIIWDGIPKVPNQDKN